MKKNLRYGLLVVFMFFVQFLGVRALSVDENELTISAGKNKSLDLYVDVEEEITDIEFNFIYSTFDIPASFVADATYASNVSGVKYYIEFGESVSGKVKLGQINIEVDDSPTDLTGTISMNGVVATVEDGSQINLDSQVITVTVGEEDPPLVDDSKKEENNEKDNEESKVESTEEKKETKEHLLKEIQSNIVKIKLKDNVFEYTIFVDDDVEALDLKAIAVNEDYKVEMTSQKISELKDSKILITVSNGEEKEVYTIKVENLEIDTESNVSKKDYKGSWIGVIIGSVIILVIGIILARKK